jgi:hypothetical protein
MFSEPEHINGDICNLKNARHEASTHFKNKMWATMKDKIKKLATKV